MPKTPKQKERLVELWETLDSVADELDLVETPNAIAEGIAEVMDFSVCCAAFIAHHGLKGEFDECAEAMIKHMKERREA